MGSIPAVCTPHWHLCCPRSHHRWCPKCHWYTPPLVQFCYRGIQIFEYHLMYTNLRGEQIFAKYMFTFRDILVVYLNTGSQHCKLVSKRVQSVSSLAKMLHLYGSGTEKDSMEAVASHKKHHCMNLHLCKENQIGFTVCKTIPWKIFHMKFLYLM